MQYKMNIEELNNRVKFLESKYVDIDLTQKQIKEDLDGHVKRILEELNKRLTGWIEEEVRLQLSQEGLRDMIKKIVTSMIDRGFLSSIAENLGEQITQGVTKRMTRELNNIKNISYSIESEIKHVNRDLPLGYEESKNVINRINRVITNSTVKRLTY